ncbi:MAG: hypothetical protein QW837_01600 [Conexivisphaerales archaeon]
MIKAKYQRFDALQRLFLEGKWFTNYIISKGISNSVSYKDKKVKVGDKFEERELIVLSSQMKQYLIKRLQNNLKSLIESKGKENWKDKVQEGAAFNTPNAIRHNL